MPLKNLAMQRKLDEGDCVDVSNCLVIPPEAGLFESGARDITKVWMGEDADVDYCVADDEAWIWSIGVDGRGRVYASTDARFYQTDKFKCVFLR